MIPGGPVVRTWLLLPGGTSSIPDPGTKIATCCLEQPKKKKIQETQKQEDSALL